MPRRPDSVVIAAHWLGYSPRCSSTRRIACCFVCWSHLLAMIYPSLPSNGSVHQSRGGSVLDVATTPSCARADGNPVDRSRRLCIPWSQASIAKVGKLRIRWPRPPSVRSRPSPCRCSRRGRLGVAGITSRAVVEIHSLAALSVPSQARPQRALQALEGSWCAAAFPSSPRWSRRGPCAPSCAIDSCWR